MPTPASELIHHLRTFLGGISPIARPAFARRVVQVGQRHVIHFEVAVCLTVGALGSAPVADTTGGAASFATDKGA
jgi:hypothetical protein